MFRIADELGMHAVVINNAGQEDFFQWTASWAIMSRDEAAIAAFQGSVVRRRSLAGVKDEEITTTYPSEADWQQAPIWTDDYSDLFSVLKGF